MTRHVEKELMRFVRREVKEKGADWGELRRVKRHVVVKRGLPNIPNLVLQIDSGLSYMGVIQWREELRLYLFDVEGKILHGQSYYSNYQNLQEVYKDIKGKSKKIARYTTSEKTLTLSQRNYELDKRFQKIWIRLAKMLQVSKSHRRKRPLIKGMSQEADGFLGTKMDDNFIYVPFNSPYLGAIFYYYSIYFFLPYSIQQNEDLGEALALKLLITFKQFKHKIIMNDRASSHIMQKMEPWDSLEIIQVFNVLKKVSIYYDSPWKTQDFTSFVNLPISLIKNPSRKKLPKIFCQLFSLCQNENFLALANFLGLPFNIECTIPTKMVGNWIISLYINIKTWNFLKVIEILKIKRISLTKGQQQAIEEAINFQYASVLQVKLPETGIFEIKNRSDSPIILTSAIQIFPDGTETEIPFQKLILKVKSTFLFDVNSLGLKYQTPVRIQYIIVKSPEDVLQPIFVGTLII